MSQRGSGLGLRRSVVAASSGLLAITMLAACSSSSSSSSSSSAPEASVVATEAATAEATAGAESAEAGSSVAAAIEATTRLQERPTSIGVVDPVGAEIPEGKTIAFIVPNVPSALAMADPLKEAAQALSWTADVINAGTSPETFVAAVNKAIQDEPDGVFIAGVPPTVIQNQLAELKAKDIPVITLGAPLGNVPEPDSGIIFNIAGIPYNTQAGVALANWVAADSDGTGSTVVIGVPDFPGPKAVTTGFVDQMTTVCPTCAVDTLDFPADTLGQSLPQTLAGYLRSHPDVKYVVANFMDMFAGVPAALKSAGITDVKLAGNTPNPPDQVNIAEGNYEAAGYMFDLQGNPWHVIDVFARHFAGVDLVASTEAPIPEWLITQANQSTWGGAPDQSWPIVADYQEQYKQLWGVG